MLSYLPRFCEWSAWKRRTIIPAFVGLFVSLFFALHPLIGSTAIILSFIPVAAVAWTMGQRAGIIGGTLAIVGNYVLLSLMGADPTSVFMRGVLSSLTLILLGGLAGWVSELVEKLRANTAQLETDHKAVIASNSRYQAVMMESTACIFLVDVTTLRVLEANPSFRELLGYSEAEMETLTLYDIVAHEPTSIDERVQRVLGQGGALLGERQYRTKAGTCIDMEVRVSLIHYTGQTVMCIVSNDITARKRVEEQLLASLQEKDVLLKEIHHRVKNNLQIISSLLNLQASNVQDADVRGHFQDSQNRVRSMALIHERLYRSEDLARIHFRSYLQDLTDQLLRSYQAPDERIRVRIEADEILLDTNQAVPCGLLINELIANALKHAFPDGKTGTVLVAMRCTPGGYQLVIQDDGVGFPAGLDHRKTPSLGLQLVNSLVRQLEGTIELNRGPGTQFTIEFPISAARES